MSGFTHAPTSAQYQNLVFELPFRTPNASSRKEAMATPGCCVKSKEREPGKFPTYLGRVVKHGIDLVVVISHPSDHQQRWVWTGSQVEYEATWNCD
jgi:hypothetical protein